MLLISRTLIPALLLVTALTTAAGAGTPDPASASLRGVIVDPSGAPVSAAEVIVTTDGGILRSTLLSDASGSFDLAAPAGRYVVTATANGFSPASKAVTATAASPASVELVLAVAGIAETVDVSAPRPGYEPAPVASATKTATPIRDTPQSITVVTRRLMDDQLMRSMADVVRFVPGITAHQGENNRDQVIIRGNSSSADFFLNGVRDDVQYYRDLYNVERVEALKGPNAMLFGRGGGGGVINRVSKDAVFGRVRDLSVDAGSFGSRRLTADWNEPLGNRVALRLNGVYEDSDSFRRSVHLNRSGINPTVTFIADSKTTITVGYEHFRDDRVSDRGIPSWQGRPVDVPSSTYFGDPADSTVDARVDTFTAALDTRLGSVAVHNRTLFGNYERGYQNFVPGAVSADRTRVTLTAYNNDTARQNLFNQTDLTFSAATGRMRHQLLAGAEFGRQATDNLRNTGYFGGGATSTFVPLANPLVDIPVTFRQSATDANNHVLAGVAAGYVQDEMSVSKSVRLVGGIRMDVFDLRYHNNRTGDDLGRQDVLLSPRAGLVVKPIERLSLYASSTVSHLPSSGDQFSSLTTITEQVKPEKFVNHEAGAKWDLSSGLSLTGAVYRLDRTNTRATDPNDPTRIVQTGAQQTRGFEIGWNGRVTSAWQIAGGYSLQDAFVVSATTSARAGAQVAQVPHHTFSLWNTYALSRRVTAGLGLVGRSDMFAAIDNTVMLPGYVVVNSALFFDPAPRFRVQVNAENLFNRTIFVNADSNTNISPGSPRSVKVALTARF